MDKLNAQIDRCYDVLCKDKHFRADKSRAGIADDQWHMNVLKYALEAEYGRGGYTFRKLTPASLLDVQRGVTYLVLGELNKSYIAAQDWAVRA